MTTAHPSHRRLLSSPLGLLALLVAAATALLLAIPLVTAPAGHAAAAHVAPPPPPYWGLGILPFLAILACIAILPLLKATEPWWHSNVNKFIVAMLAAGLTILYYLPVTGLTHLTHALNHAVLDEYVPFIILLLSLYVISGGINLRGDLPAHPLTNTIFLAIGAGAASFIGTTGASMVLIRPLLQTNSERKHVVHTVVFFIFLVSNCGGCLLPIGDPPLFLGYLKGVPFWWTLELWREWLVCCGLLLIIYFIWDTMAYRRETAATIRHDESVRKPLRLRGWINFLWLAGVVAAVALIVPGKPLRAPLDVLAPAGFIVFPFMRETIMLALIGLSLVTTPRGVREANRFSYFAIIEVAVLFIGIFIAMQVPVEVLKAKGGDLGLDLPWHFFWATGTLSAFLDNAPTYVVFFQVADAMTLQPGPGIIQLVDGGFMRTDLLTGISLGAVFMGAMTYIGNGPNFMVKSIAEQSGVRMPSFFGFMVKYSLPVLVPLFVLITVVFLR